MGPRVIVAGFLARFPLGGYVWEALHYLVGFRRLGCEVAFYEDTAHYAEAYDPVAGQMESRYAYGVSRLDGILGGFGFAGRWVFWDAGRNRYHGLGESETEALFARADLFVNLGGVNRIGRRRRPPVAVYVDIDPAFTQITLDAGDRLLREVLAEHDLHYTFGENVGTARSPLPTGGFRWRPTRPVVVPDLWASAALPADGPFTTIGKWDSPHRDLVFRGQRYGWRKSREWMKFVELPLRTGERFEVAMDVASVPGDVERLTAGGWSIRDPLAVSIDHELYRRYVQHSKGEFSAAKDMNVRLRSGWFSDRSVCYLAAGRPAILEDTGFSDVLPCGRGLFAVRDLAQAEAAVDAVRSDYAAHARGAVEVARDCFAPEVVLRAMLADAGLG